MALEKLEKSDKFLESQTIGEIKYTPYGIEVNYDIPDQVIDKFYEGEVTYDIY